MLDPHRPGALEDLGPGALENSLRDYRCPSCQIDIPGRWTISPAPEASVKSHPDSVVALKYDLINLYGSFARNQRDTASDIDLLVIGNPNGDALVEAVQKLERQLGREIK